MAGVLLVVLAVVVARGLTAGSGSSGGGSSGGDGCPTDRPSVRVAALTSTPMFEPVPGEDFDTTLYRLDVEFEVTNEASEPIVVEQIEAGVASHPDAVITALGNGDEVAPGETVTVEGSGEVEIDGAGGGMLGPADVDSIELFAQAADGEHAGCDISNAS